MRKKTARRHTHTHMHIHIHMHKHIRCFQVYTGACFAMFVLEYIADDTKTGKK